MPTSVIVVGTSLGGLSALNVLLAGIPGDLRLPPLVIVQHRTKISDDALVSLLRTRTSLHVSEPSDKEALASGHVYIAPADYHLLVEPGSLALSTEAPVNHARPSIDVLFESAAIAYGKAVLGVVLTGSNHDGAWGAAQIKRRGGVVLVQDLASAESRPMPAAAIAATNVDQILPLAELPRAICALCREDGG